MKLIKSRAIEGEAKLSDEQLEMYWKVLKQAGTSESFNDFYNTTIATINALSGTMMKSHVSNIQRIQIFAPILQRILSRISNISNNPIETVTVQVAAILQKGILFPYGIFQDLQVFRLNLGFILTLFKH